MLRLINKRPGFGLLEAVIASGILVVLTSVTVGISHVIVTKSSDFDNKIVAANLAQSGIEAAYAIRDNNLNDSDPLTTWDYGFKNTQLLANPSETLHCNHAVTLSGSSTVTNLGASCGLSVPDDEIMYSDVNMVGIHYINRLTPQTINYNNTDFVREIFIQQKSVDVADVYEIRSIVFLKSDNTVLSDISAQLTNWKDTDSKSRDSI